MKAGVSSLGPVLEGMLSHYLLGENIESCLFASIMVPERAAKGTLLLDLSKFCFDDDSEAPNNQFNFTTPSGVGSGSRFLQDPAGSGTIVVS